MRVAGDEAGRDHDGRVGGVGAGGDGCDGHITVLDVEVATEIGGDGDRLLHGLVGLIVQQGGFELRLGFAQLDAVLRALRACDGRHDSAEVELEIFGILRFHVVRVSGVAPQLIGLGVGFDEGNLLFGTTGQTQIVERNAVDWEDAAGGAEFRSHVADGGAVSQRHGSDAFAVEFHEFADHTVLAEHVGDGEDHVGGGDAFRNGTGELEADDARHEHGDRLAEHGGFGFDAADAPAEHAQTVDGGGVRIGAHAGVEVGEVATALPRLGHDDFGEVFDVDLVDDAGSRRHHAEVAEGLLAPTQELVAFAVALVFDVHVLFDRVGHAVLVDLHGMVDDHVGLDLRVDDLRISAKLLDGVTHGGEVDDARHAGEVLHDHAGRGELDLVARLCGRIPIQQGLDMIIRDVGAIDVAHQVLNKNLQRIREMIDARQIRDTVKVVILAAHLQGVELVVAHRHATSELLWLVETFQQPIIRC